MESDEPPTRRWSSAEMPFSRDQRTSKRQSASAPTFPVGFIHRLKMSNRSSLFGTRPSNAAHNRTVQDIMDPWDMWRNHAEASRRGGPGPPPRGVRRGPVETDGGSEGP